MIIEWNGKKPDVARAAFIAENAVICGDVTLEEGSSVWYGAVLRADTGPIRIGKNSNVQDNCVMHCDEGGKIEIGENVTVGHGAILHGCTVEDGCMIGMGSIVLNGAVIRKESLVGAGALVTEGKDFAEHMLILGSPAREVKPVSGEQIRMMQKGAAEYLALSALMDGSAMPR